MICTLNLLVLILNAFFIEKYLHIYQCRDYNNLRYLKFFNKKHIIFIILCVCLLIFELFLDNLYILFSINLIIFIIQCLIISTLVNSKKTPIIYTDKLKRLYLISVLLLCLFSFFKISVLISAILIYFLPIISNFLNFYDKLKNKKYILNAQEKIKNSRTKIIAITGSNGKTSVKNILFEMIKEKFKIIKTPASYNTSLGIAKCVNESLTEDTDFLILEYGARRCGDVKKLCETFGADYGILTTIAPQHLESFKSILNIQNTKNELPEFLKEKLCVFNYDNELSKTLFNKKIGKKECVSLNTKTQVRANNIKIKDGKTYFKLYVGKKSYNAETNLLGEHNITNILLCTSLALNLEIEIEQIISIIKSLQPTPHRLELIKTHINILDDSYNCSLSSATEALKVLKNFNGKKMVVTPGIIEGGASEKQINFELGEMCAFCDYVVIVGNHNKDSLLLGLQTQKFDVKKICFASSLDDAKQYFHLLSNNDTLLLLNDLPDDYS